jgi:hypothetical protein
MGWNKITVRQYIALKPLNKKILDLEAMPKPEDMFEAANLNISIMEAKCEKLALMFGKPLNYFETLPSHKFVGLYKDALYIESLPLPRELNPTIQPNKIKYTAITNPAKFNVHQWYAYLGYKEDIRGNMAKLLPWFYIPEGFDYTKEPSDYEEDLLDAKLSDVSGCFFLLSRLWSKWQAAVKISNQTIIMETMEVISQAEQWQMSKSTTDGIMP